VDIGKFTRANLLEGRAPNSHSPPAHRPPEMSNKVALQPLCGAIAYSVLPNAYSLVLGMTGTLECLSAYQKKILSDYGLHMETYLPSTFRKRDLAKKPTHVEMGEYNAFFDKVFEEAISESNSGRAVLVIFEDEHRLKKFAEQMQSLGKQLAPDQGPLVLNGKLTHQEMDEVVIKSMKERMITLVNRPFGRGTDFKCVSNRLLEFGGVHIIMTFLPENASEAVQIEGRTCRQDDPGSCCRIFWHRDLKHLGSNKPGFGPRTETERWDSYLSEEQDEYMRKSYERIEAEKSAHLVKYNETKRAVTLCAKAISTSGILNDPKKHWQPIANAFSASLAGSVGLVDMTEIDVCFVMDCTFSMSDQIEACQARVMSITDDILKAVGSGMGAVRMSFIGYRDYKEEDPGKYDHPGSVQVCAFTENIGELRKFVMDQEATGGGDGPEDICGKHSCVARVNL
jgi:hypothetical protein